MFISSHCILSCCSLEGGRGKGRKEGGKEGRKKGRKREGEQKCNEQDIIRIEQSWMSDAANMFTSYFCC